MTNHSPSFQRHNGAVPIMTDVDPVDKFKAKYGATNEGGRYNNCTEAWIDEDGIVGISPVVEERFGEMVFGKATPADDHYADTVEYDDVAVSVTVFESDSGNAYVQDQYLDRLADVLQTDVSTLREHARLIWEAADGSSWHYAPVTFDVPGREYRGVIPPFLHDD